MYHNKNINFFRKNNVGIPEEFWELGNYGRVWGQTNIPLWLFLNLNLCNNERIHAERRYYRAKFR